MKQELSILIPTYNDVCTELVGKLCAQAKAIDRLDYEIIVADDGSTDSDCTEANQAIESMPAQPYATIWPGRPPTDGCSSSTAT